ncbi:hypothetical protein BOX15_Mlig024331g1 [Macrostomum lignano]|uniref:Uncharacterized protein n=2 Tax=Macrostomum lignano TaxID=282301 RepID=A0A267GQH5_9PLAT|nr:hypothetical protein BOX15_Mlig024331g1 [Macrostomum lignano]
MPQQRDRQTSTTEDAFHDIVNNHASQTSAYVRRAMRRETDAQTLFGTLGDNAFRSKKRQLFEQLAPGSNPYAESGFRNAKPQYQSSYIVHPEWVSEQTAAARQRQQTTSSQTAKQ